MKHVIEYGLAVGIGGLMRLAPRRMRLACGRALGSLVYALDARHRNITIDNVSQAYGNEKSDEETRAIAEGAFRHFGAMVFELITLGSPSANKIDALVALEGAERYQRARAKGKGVILITGHFGNWELHGVAHGYHLGRIHVLARVQDNPYLNRWLEKIRAISGNEVVYKQKALTHMRRLLRAGETIALVIDQNVHVQDAVFVDFFWPQGGNHSRSGLVRVEDRCDVDAGFLRSAFRWALPRGVLGAHRLRALSRHGSRRRHPRDHTRARARARKLHSRASGLLAVDAPSLENAAAGRV